MLVQREPALQGVLAGCDRFQIAASGVFRPKDYGCTGVEVPRPSAV